MYDKQHSAFVDEIHSLHIVYNTEIDKSVGKQRGRGW